MTTDNRTNVQIVADALRSMPEAKRDDDRDPAVVVAEYAVAALEAAARAAQGAAPQAECDCGAGPGSAVCKKVCATRAPVLPSSGVDEEKLAEVIDSHERTIYGAHSFSGCAGCGERYVDTGIGIVRWFSQHRAHAVAEWLKGQER